MFFQHLPCDGFCFQLCRATVHKHAAYQDLSVFRVFQACFNCVFVSCKSNCVPVPCKILFTSVDRCSCSWYMIHSTHVHTCHEKGKRPYKSHRWGMHGDVQQPRMLMSANIFKHFGKYTMISQRPYLVPPAVPVAFISMVLLHLLSARTLEPVWERISERWGASRWPWQRFSDQQNWNENISRLKTVQIFCRFIGKKECSQLFSCLLTPNNWPPLLVIFPSLYR